MKILLPLSVLIAIALGCVAPGRGVRSHPVTPSQPSGPAPTLQYTKPRWEKNGVYLLLHFEVKNTTKQNLEYIQIHASFYDAKDQFVTSEEIYIDRWRGLGPGQRSAATVQTRPNSQIKSVRLEFTCHSPDTMDDVGMDATEVNKL